MTDFLTTCRVEQGLATKVYTRTDDGWSKQDYMAPSQVVLDAVAVEDIAQLSRALDALAAKQDVFVVRGELLARGRHARRYKDHLDGIAPGLRPRDRRWILVDLDGVPWLGDAPTLGEAVAHVRQFLPAWLWDVTTHARWSASAGVDGWAELRLHLWFWLTRPLCDEALRGWAKDRPYVDHAVYNPVQPHYTATPRFVGGPDPIAVRSALIRGARDAAVPPPELVDTEGWASREWDEQLAAQAQAAQIERNEGRATARERWADKAIAEALDDIRGAPKGERNDTINRCVYRIARLVAGGHVDATIRATVEQLAVAVCHDEQAKAKRTVASAWEAGSREPRALEHVAGRPAGASAGPPDPAPSPDPPAAATAPGLTIVDLCAGLEDDHQVKREIRVGDVVRDAPDPDAAVPHGWWVTHRATGRWYETRGGELKTPVVAHAPIAVVGRGEDVETQAQLLLLAWRRPDGWRRRLLPRIDAVDARRVMALAEYGCPVTSASSKDIARYVSDYEATNYQRIPLARVSTTLGWQGHRGEHGFLLGPRHYTRKGCVEVDLEHDDPTRWTQGSVAFRALSDGDRQFVRSFAPEGTIDGWRAMVQRLGPYPRARLAVLASFSAPLVEVVGAPNYCIDLAGRTSSGKTTALRIAASVWGNPDERSGRSVIRSWDATPVGIERTLELLHSLPLFLDDTARAAKPEDVTATLYAVAQGQGRLRGNIARTDAARSWRTVLISTGEQPATSFSEAGGARARTIQIVGSPFAGPHASRDVELVNLEVLDHYGVAGELFLGWLLSNRSGWARLRQGYKEAVERHVRGAKAGPEARLAHVRALLEVTHACVERALELDLADPLAELWPEIAADLHDAAGEGRALNDAVSWVLAHKSQLIGVGNQEPNQGWLGVWKACSDSVVAVFRHRIEEFLVGRGFSPRAVLEGWRDRGWLEVDQDRPGRLTKLVRVSGARARCVCFPMRFFDVSPNAGGRVTHRDSKDPAELPGLSPSVTQPWVTGKAES